MMEFRSATKPGVVYTVRTTEWGDECDCPGFAYRRRCRHVDAVVEARRPPDTRDGDTHEVLD